MTNHIALFNDKSTLLGTKNAKTKVFANLILKKYSPEICWYQLKVENTWTWLVDQ